ncbi:CBS domain-containing protein [Heyndrickxia sp. NPDC080065]|uniref:CBS domain-containing protein n=1 Tax=Heyndrickxia sp. NPDC080065 TaxID=3390568 RepID=UPI003D0569EE
MKVKDFMIQDVISVKEDDTIKHLLNTLVKHKIGGVPVINADGTLLGMISDGDVLRSIKPKDTVVYDFYSLMAIAYEKGNLEDAITHLKDQPVIKIAKKRSIITVKEDDDMETVLRILAKHHFKKIPVIDNQRKVVGVISRGDIIRSIQKDILQSL